MEIHCMSLPAISGYGENFPCQSPVYFPFMLSSKCMDAIERLVFTAAAAVIIDVASISNFYRQVLDDIRVMHTIDFHSVFF